MGEREWKPGDVALVTEYDPPLIALVGYRKGSNLLMFKYADGGFDAAGRMNIGDGDILDIAARPLVVIDPEDREQVERLADALGTCIADTEAALREFADPKPPKPDEPTGLGAVVEDELGDLWIRRAFAPEWFHAKGNAFSVKWSSLSVVRVLSEGVQAGEPA